MRALAAVAALTAAGLAIRLVLAGQSVFADEISTYSVVSSNDFAGVVSTVHGDQEITPPLYFLLAWITTRIDLTPELLRAPSLLAGAATIPLIYALGLRTVGRGAALAGAAIAALSPFLIFYSSEARGYAVATMFVLVSTISLLQAADGRGRGWWVGYAAAACAAVYAHYTSIFPLAAQFLWLLLARPQARLPALAASAAAAVAFLPWLSGLRADLDSPTTDILSALDEFTLDSVRVTLEHWVVGHPIISHATPLRELPGWPVLAAILLGFAIAVVGIVLDRRREPSPDPVPLDGILLLLAIAIGVPAGLAVASAVGTDVLSVRHLASAWPALALLLGWLVAAAPSPLRYAAAFLVIGGYAVSAVEMTESRFARPDYQGAARYIERHSGSRDVVIDATKLSPAPISAMDIALDDRRRLFYLGRFKVQFDPFKLLAPPPPPARVARRAAAAARGGRIFLVVGESILRTEDPALGPDARAVSAALPGFRPAVGARYPGLLDLAVLVYSPRP
jgi:Dolichyl-phosphate-mannose-protein mannosyltransferase